MPRSGCDQVRLQPDGVEDVVGGEAGPDVRPAGGGVVDRGQALPTARAVASLAMPSRSSAFQSGWTCGARNPIAKQPASRSCATSGGTLDGAMPPAARSHSHS